MSADVTAWVRALAADFESRGDFATASDLLALCTAYAQVTAERDAALRFHGDEQAAHMLTADTLRKCIRDGDKAEQYRVERDQALKQLATRRADLAAQVEGMGVIRLPHGYTPSVLVSRDEVLTLLRGPHAD